MNPNQSTARKFFTNLLFVLAYWFAISFAYSLSKQELILSLLVGLSSIIFFLIGKKLKKGVYCTWCGSHKVRLDHSDTGKLFWEYRNKDGSQDKRVKDNFQRAPFIGYWKCKVCGSTSKTQHQPSKSPKKKDEILTLKLLEPGAGERYSCDFEATGLKKTSEENRKNQ